ncbi:carcinoembryonic antigen-related cell adhesion molecule 5-like, partial [Protobothrops mucrosquamatus]|uniref:carcinoembryonic antigen-related cell adhesion molecule 5-like n=1 Tax=Protobothrops mucrosquamatus TaxID=103944 RepID=UPI0007758079
MVFWAGAILHSSVLVAQTGETIVIEAIPPNPVETFEVLLKPPTPPETTIFCTWYRQSTGADPLLVVQSVNKTGPGYTGRETIYPDCSLHIKELQLNDTANYLLTIAGATISNGNIRLEVTKFVPKPNVVISPSPFIVELQAVQLRCNTTITQNVSWLKDGHPLPPEYNLTDHNRILSIASAAKEDTGAYQCEVPNGDTPVTSDPAHLSVIYGPEVPVIHPNNACNKEYQTIILNCLAASYPGPQYTWYRDGTVMDRGPKLIIENFTESQAGIYVCEALNELLQTRNESDGQHIRLEK